MSLEILGKPIFIWFGVLTLISLFVTAYFGFRMRKYGMAMHKRFAYVTLTLALLHFLFGAWQALF